MLDTYTAKTIPVWKAVKWLYQELKVLDLRDCVNYGYEAARLWFSVIVGGRDIRIYGYTYTYENGKIILKPGMIVSKDGVVVPVGPSEVIVYEYDVTAPPGYPVHTVYIKPFPDFPSKQERTFIDETKRTKRLYKKEVNATTNIRPTIVVIGGYEEALAVDGHIKIGTIRYMGKKPGGEVVTSVVPRKFNTFNIARHRLKPILDHKNEVIEINHLSNNITGGATETEALKTMSDELLNTAIGDYVKEGDTLYDRIQAVIDVNGEWKKGESDLSRKNLNDACVEIFNKEHVAGDTDTGATAKGKAFVPTDPEGRDYRFNSKAMTRLGTFLIAAIAEDYGSQGPPYSTAKRIDAAQTLEEDWRINASDIFWFGSPSKWELPSTFFSTFTDTKIELRCRSVVSSLEEEIACYTVYTKGLLQILGSGAASTLTLAISREQP